jgi:hypothetical protein
MGLNAWGMICAFEVKKKQFLYHLENLLSALVSCK